MMQAIIAVAGLFLVAFMVLTVLSGAWYGTWAGSGREPNDPGFPGARPTPRGL